MRATDWDEIERGVRACRAPISRRRREVYVEAESVIGDLRHGPDPARARLENVAMLVNLLLLRAISAATGAGISPGARPFQRAGPAHRRHHREARARAARQAGGAVRLRAAAREGHEHGRGLRRRSSTGTVKAFIGLGGNFLRAIPERERMEAAWPRAAT